MASKGILIGKLIYSTVTSNDDINSYISNVVTTNGVTTYENPRIYPIVAPNDTIFPFIVYTRSTVYPARDTKDGWCDDKVSFQITVASDKYDESAVLADKVRDLFENCKITNSELSISNIRMVSVSEMFQDDTYIQNINFDCDAV